MNPMDEFGLTPLHFAAQNGHFKICELITEKDGEKYHLWEKGCTPLHYTAINGDLELCRLFVKNDLYKNLNNLCINVLSFLLITFIS